MHMVLTGDTLVFDYLNVPGISVLGSHSAMSGKTMINNKIRSMGINTITTSRNTCTTFNPAIDDEMSRHKP